MSYNPNHADIFRTTLVQNGQLEMVEFCEDVGKMIGCDVEFENPSMRGVITTVLTKNDVVPEAMGFQLEDEYPNRSMRPEPREQAKNLKRVVEQQMR